MNGPGRCICNVRENTNFATCLPVAPRSRFEDGARWWEYRLRMPEPRDVPSEKPQPSDNAPAKNVKPGHEVEDAAEQEFEYPADETNEG